MGSTSSAWSPTVNWIAAAALAAGCLFGRLRPWQRLGGRVRSASPGCGSRRCWPSDLRRPGPRCRVAHELAHYARPGQRDAGVRARSRRDWVAARSLGGVDGGHQRPAGIRLAGGLRQCKARTTRPGLVLPLSGSRKGGAAQLASTMRVRLQAGYTWPGRRKRHNRSVLATARSRTSSDHSLLPGSRTVMARSSWGPNVRHSSTRP